MQHSIVVLLLPFLVSASVTGFAADAGDLILGEFDATSKKERIEIARAILGDINKLSDYMTTPSPSEIDWVLAEQKSIASLKGTDAYDDRSTQLHFRAEFQTLKLNRLLRDIERALQCVVGENTSIEDTSIAQEILCWSRASLDLSTRSTINSAIPVLLKHGRLPKDIREKAGLGFGNLDYSYRFDWMAHGINEYIVIPYLQGKITE